MTTATFETYGESVKKKKEDLKRMEQEVNKLLAEQDLYFEKIKKILIEMGVKRSN